MVVGGLEVLRNQPLFGTSVITLGLVFTFLQYVQRFNMPIQQIAVMWTNIQSAIAGGERIFGLLGIVPDVADKPGAQTMPTIQGKVEFVDAKAEYQKGVPVLHGISFTAEPGQTIAIVGPTGAGKTTIINLLPRFYDVSSGAVKIDGIDVRDVTRESLRRQIGIVLQDSFLILDEATSSVDTRTERLIQQAFDKLLEGRTSFVIAHRLSTIRHADQVLMLQAGQIVERGTHDELLALRGAYYELYMSQFRREEEPVAAD